MCTLRTTGPNTIPGRPMYTPLRMMCELNGKMMCELNGKWTVRAGLLALE